MRILKPTRSPEATLDDLLVARFDSHCRDSATFPVGVLGAKKMAPRLRGGPAVECLHLQAFATGGGGAYPRCILEAMARRRSCQAVLTMALHPNSFSIRQVLNAQDQTSESVADARFGGGSCRSATSAA